MSSSAHVAAVVRPLQLRKKDAAPAAFSSNGSITPPASPRSSTGSTLSGASHHASPPLTVYLRALHPYTASPDPDSSGAPCLSLRDGSILYVHSVHSSGWADGSLLDGTRGWFPSNYCEPYVLSVLQQLTDARTALEAAVGASDEARYGAGVAAMVASVRGILDQAGCLSREAALVQQHEQVRRDRKWLLSELSGLANVAKTRTAGTSAELGAALLMRSERVVGRAGKFVHAVGPLCGLYAAEEAFVRNQAPELVTTPPVSFDGSVQGGIPELQEHHEEPLTPQASTQGEHVATLSALANLHSTHATFYAFLSAFIGRLQLQQQTQAAHALGAETRGCVQVAREFLAVLETVSSQFRQDRLLVMARDGLYTKISKFVAQAQGLVQVCEGEVFETDRLVASATGIVKGAGDCLARATFVLETQGDFELPSATQEAWSQENIGLPRDDQSSSTLASSVDVGDRRSRDVQAQVEALSIPYRKIDPLVPTSPTEADASEHASTRVRASTDADAHYSLGRLSLAETGSLAPSCETKRQSGASLLDFDAEDFEVAHNAEGHLTGATLASLVVNLTPADQAPDAQFTTTFFLTFRTFTKPVALATLLVARFAITPPSPCPSNWEAAVAMPIRLRVYNVFKYWVDSYWRPDTDAEALSVMDAFAKGLLAATLPQAGKRLAEWVEQLSSESGHLVEAKRAKGVVRGPAAGGGAPALLSDAPVPPPMMTKVQLASLRASLASLDEGVARSPCSVLDFDDLELARQLTLLESDPFCNITPIELIGQEFSKKKGQSLAVHVKAMSAASTDLAGWVADSILAETEQKRRTLVLKQWLKVAERCAQLSNYNTLMAIMSALNSSTIARLKRTWDGLNRSQRSLLDHLRSVTDHQRNYALYRARLRQTTTPCLPFLGLFLTDLTFVDEGNPSTRPSKVTDRPLINFDKHAKAAKIVFELQKFQVPYRLAAVPELQAYIKRCLAAIRTSTTDHWRRSLILEPRVQQAQTMRRESSAASAASEAEVGSSSGSVRSLKPRLFASWTS